jgi:hypothetical protein
LQGKRQGHRYRFNDGLVPLFQIPLLHKRAFGAHGHPSACALLEEIHPNTVTANVFSVPDPFVGDAAMDYRNIAEHLHVNRSKFMRHKFVLAGFKALQNCLPIDHPARGCDCCPIVGIDLIELVDIDGHQCIAHLPFDLLDSGEIGRIIECRTGATTLTDRLRFPDASARPPLSLRTTTKLRTIG